ncbi:MAG TPA: amidase family protein, partial [Vicinamibacterales bacterium]|nr:amidase family protein [Vicinamibacterales bacterium]
MNSESATEITSLGADALAALIRRRRLGAVEALEAYLRRIDAVNPALNAIIHLDAERAMARAQTLDARCRPLGPLHGIPMTLKDAHRVRGMPTRVGDPEAPTTTARTDGAVAARLRAAGAVLIGKTNVSRNLADFGAQNPIHGRTAHPADPSRTPGGSSGGAAAALAAYLTPLEVGSDLAGSIRIPAAFCGIVGLKPSMGLVPVAGHVSDPVRHPRGGGSNVLTSVGPMARTLDDLDLLLRVLTGRSSRTHRRTDEGSLTFIEPFEA